MAALTLEDVMAEVVALRRDTEARIADLTAQVAALKAVAHPPEPEEIGPETLVMMAAVVTSFLGVKVRIRSARRIDGTSDATSAWAQHSRVFVQSAAHAMQRIAR
ncbi:MAG: hypothetical protein GC191_00775 [Azospirillum sp.]|nr:hypothetical protein [Azospirillum sp.]